MVAVFLERDGHNGLMTAIAIGIDPSVGEFKAGVLVDDAVSAADMMLGVIGRAHDRVVGTTDFKVRHTFEDREASGAAPAIGVLKVGPHFVDQYARRFENPGDGQGDIVLGRGASVAHRDSPFGFLEDRDRGDLGFPPRTGDSFAASRWRLSCSWFQADKAAIGHRGRD